MSQVTVIQRDERIYNGRRIFYSSEGRLLTSVHRPVAVKHLTQERVLQRNSHYGTTNHRQLIDGFQCLTVAIMSIALNWSYCSLPNCQELLLVQQKL